MRLIGPGLLYFDLRNACMQRKICVAVRPVIDAVDVLCSCDRLWMVEAEYSARVLTSACIWCVLFLQEKSAEVRRTLHSQQ